MKNTDEGKLLETGDIGDIVNEFVNAHSHHADSYGINLKYPDPGAVGQTEIV